MLSPIFRHIKCIQAKEKKKLQWQWTSKLQLELSLCFSLCNSIPVKSFSFIVMIQKDCRCLTHKNHVWVCLFRSDLLPFNVPLLHTPSNIYSIHTQTYMYTVHIYIHMSPLFSFPYRLSSFIHHLHDWIFLVLPPSITLSFKCFPFFLFLVNPSINRQMLYLHTERYVFEGISM